jgi:hypothetical protein
MPAEVTSTGALPPAKILRTGITSCFNLAVGGLSIIIKHVIVTVRDDTWWHVLLFAHCKVFLRDQKWLSIFAL